MPAPDIITSEQFSLSMQKLGVEETRPKIAVAVSGGGDSLALAVLMQEWVKARGGELLALTVDHGLRSGSAQEAEAVQKLLRERDIPGDVLMWGGDKPETGIQEKAREARYDLLLNACRARKFPFLAVAHNQEDQIETFWMRLAHGSGLDGLTGIAPFRVKGGVTIIRPVLSFPRQILRDTCLHHGIQWIEDPSNENEKFLRVKLRGFEEVLAEEGLTPHRILQTLQKLEEARESLRWAAAEALKACASFYPEGHASLKISEWKKFPSDVQRRVLTQILSAVSGGGGYLVGYEALKKTRLGLLDSDFAGKTLSGCEIFSGRGKNVWVAREPSAVEGRIPAGEGVVWDGRFIFSGDGTGSLEIGALGEAGLSQLRKNAKDREDLPFKIKCTLPALWSGENLVAVPHLGYYGAGCPAGIAFHSINNI